MNKDFIFFSLLVVILCFSFDSAWASRNPSYFETSSKAKEAQAKKEGYFFYKDPKPLPEKEEIKPIEPTTIVQVTKEKEEEKNTGLNFNGKIPWNRVEKMHPIEYSDLMTDVLNYAIQDPDDGNRVRDYVTLQYLAIKRSEDFQQKWGQVLLENPSLDTTASRPMNTPASVVLNREETALAEEALAKMRDDMGIMVFVRTGCGYCAEQSEIFKRFMNDYQWKNYVEINIDEHPSLAEEYEVDLVPDIYVVANFDGDIHRKRLRVGLTTGGELVDLLLNAYFQWFKGEDFRSPLLKAGDTAFERHLDAIKREGGASDESLRKVSDEYKKQIQKGIRLGH